MIPPGQPIMDISPSGDHLIIGSKIEPKNIDSIGVGSSLKYVLVLLNPELRLYLPVRFVSLSPDIVIDQRHQMDNRYAGGYYLAL